MGVNTLTVIPGYQLGATEELTVSILNQMATPTVQATLDDPFNDENYFRNGNMYSPFWTTPGGVNCPAGSQTTNAQYWYVQPNGSGNVNCLEDNARTPDLLSLYSAKLVGATGITDVLFLQQISSDLSATLRRVCTVSGWIYNGNATPFTPTLQVATANALGNFATVTVRADLSFASCPAGQWTYVSLSQDFSVYTNVANGLQLGFHFPSGVLNSSANSVNLDRLKVQPGGLATAFADDISLFTSIPTVGTSNIQNGAVTAAKIAANTVGVGQLDPTCGICPPGSIVMYGNAISLPTGWLGALGTEVSRATYSALFSAITVSVTATSTSGSAILTGSGFPTTWADGTAIVSGIPISGPGIATNTTITSITSTTIHLSLNAVGNNSGATYVLAPWGIGDGSTTFNLPDLRGRVPVGHGQGIGGLTARQVGQAAGEEKHSLITAELATHTHAVTDPTHTHVINDPGHVHGITDPTHVHSYINAIASAGSTVASGSGFGFAANNTGAASTGITISSHTTGVFNSAIATGITNQNTGSGTAHNTMQPYSVVLFIVKT